MSQGIRRILFLLFFLSGFCSLVYQVVWTRLAFASFGIISPVLSVVLSVFMLGLSVGSWLGGRFAASWKKRGGVSAVTLYALAELAIGVGAFAVPKLFVLGEWLLLSSGQTDSVRYLVLSAAVLAVSILPWCLFMGATFPLMMAFVREQEAENSESFSFLYLANVLGAMAGTLMTAVVLIEWFGFRDTLRLAAAANFLIAATGFYLGRRAASMNPVSPEQSPVVRVAVEHPRPGLPGWQVKGILFATGFGAMAMEVIWTRAFATILRTQVYSYALIVFSYLVATFLGSLWYRRDLRRGRTRSAAELLSLLTIAAFLPVLVNTPRLLHWSESGVIHWPSAIALLVAIGPLCAVLGYLTPGLIDTHAGGDPGETGRLYAINVLGCILGPLTASYVLLPFMSEKTALLLLSAPCLVAALMLGRTLTRRWQLATGVAAVTVLAGSLFFSDDFETFYLKHGRNTAVRRDHAASVISVGTGRNKQLLVNGVGMTTLSPITKFMLHLPLALHNDRPASALIICFGMGTTYRSALSWDIETTAVELVPSVKDAFGFYHADAAEYLGNPKGRIVIDDGRRYLQRCGKKYDVIVIDPPPPVAAAGSSLLYSREFYSLAKRHLATNGILQAWYPGGGDLSSRQAVLRSLRDSFPYLRCFCSVEGWGIHLLASMSPIPDRTAQEMVSRMPENARKDLMEWNAAGNLPAYVNLILSRELIITNLTRDPLVTITDDQPYNEYFLLRKIGL